MNTLNTLVGKLAGYKAAKFASFTYTSKSNGEIARYTLILNANTENIYRRDIETLNGMIPTLFGIEQQAAMEIRASLETSLAVGVGFNPDYTNMNTYWLVPGIKNLKVHKKTGDLYIAGLLVNKTVIQEGTERKPVKSSDLTIAKRRIDRQLRRGQYRFFAVPNVHEVRMDGETLVVISG